jgi:hypothetical protein
LFKCRWALNGLYYVELLISPYGGRSIRREGDNNLTGLIYDLMFSDANKKKEARLPFSMIGVMLHQLNEFSTIDYLSIISLAERYLQNNSVSSISGNWSTLHFVSG